MIALGKQHCREDGVHGDGERGGGRLEDAGPLLQVGRTDWLWSGLAKWELGSECVIPRPAAPVVFNPFAR